MPSPRSTSGVPPAPNTAPGASPSFWIGVVSRDHVAAAVAGDFVQLNHGKPGPLLRMREGDGFAFYSPRAAYPDGAPVQAFTAIGRVPGGTIFQVEMTDGFAPFRRQVRFLPAREAPIKPLIDALSFIRSKAHWGAAFRFGFLRVPEDDFAIIAAAMGRELSVDFAAAAIV
jgi:hypothetical protein